ncbi:S8 family peptidase [Streptomyces virginiae]|uniref:S8 family peptidase n=1 Tax=Streptomyces virginiae TaxID=1961 RepID=UPI0036831F3B
MPIQPQAPWGLARISHRPQLSFKTLNRYEYNERPGAGVDVYLLDTGIAIDNVDFEGRAYGGFVVTGEDIDDDNGRGTHLAGIVAGLKHGVAKHAVVHSVKVADSQGAAEPKDIIRGLEWALAHTKERGGPSVALLGACLPPDAALDAQVNAAVEQGLFVVVPAGDENKDAGDLSPARAAGAFTVGASNVRDERTHFSNYGPAVDIFAPGEGILSTHIGSPTSTTRLDGTAQAAAHVAGLAAYLLSTVENVTTSTIRDTIIALASKDMLSDVPENTCNLLAFNNAITS